MQLEDPVRDYEHVLRNEGPAGLSYLNARIQHRYSAVYQLNNGVLRNLYVFDKLGEVVPEFLQEVPLQDSFCQFVLRDGVFRTVGSAEDGRLDGHKYQGAIGSYHGLPIVDNFGELFGTICHFDIEPLSMAEEEFLIFKKAARVLPKYLHKSSVRLP